MKTKMLGDFQICISVPLRMMVRNIKTKIMKCEFSQKKVTIVFIEKSSNHESFDA